MTLSQTITKFGSVLLALALLALAALFVPVAPTHAQQINPLDVEVDANGVDWLSGELETQTPTLSIPAAPELTFRKAQDFFPLLQGTVPSGGNSTTDQTSYQINAGGLASDGFSCFDGCSNKNENGSVLDGGPTTGPFIYTQGGSAKRIRFDEKRGFTTPPAAGDTFFYMGTLVETPGGPTLTFDYQKGNNPIMGMAFWELRVTTVTSTSGYQLKFTYKNDTDPSNYLWRQIDKVEIVRTAAPSVALASLQYGPPSSSLVTVTDIAGRVYEFRPCSAQATGVCNSQGYQWSLPGETNPTFDMLCTQPGYAGCGNLADYTLNIKRDEVVYNYDITHTGSIFNDAPERIVVTGPENYYRRVEIESFIPAGVSGCGTGLGPCWVGLGRNRVSSITNSENQTTSYNYFAHPNAPWSRIESIDYPGGRSTSLTYDTSANVTSLTTSGPDGSITQTATYNVSFECTSILCFRPTATTDGKGNQTDYTWSSTHGGLLTQLDPADESNIRAKTKNTYDSDGRLIKTELCEASLSGAELTCGTANSFVTTYTYFGATWLPLTETITDGVGNGPLTTTYTYDSAGRRLSADGPLPGSDDATYARYDILGRQIWEIGPKNEAGTRPATKTSYRDADDQPTEVLTGTVAGNTTALFPVTEPALTLISDTDTQYNARRLATRATVSNGGTTYAVTDMSYDALNRNTCTATRMNLSSLPSDACTPGTVSSDGPDRITRQHYDNESRVVRIEQGVGTSLVRDYATYEFNTNGEMTAMTDARGYRAEMTYDGFGRQKRWYFPSAAATGVINPGDYEEYTYDANGNRTTLRKRDGSVITYTYDNLNRVIEKVVPGRSGLDPTHTRDIFYQYDIRGLQLHARFDSDAGHGVITEYDRYGRRYKDIQWIDWQNRDVFHAYDAGGNRTEIYHSWDNARFKYYYSSGGQFDRIVGPWGVTLINYNYDTLGRLNRADRYGTAPNQYFAHDGISRLNVLAIGVSSTNTTVRWDFTRNAANQIKSETQSNDSFSWNGYQPLNRAYTTNGLNQYTNVEGQAYCYDPNGNLTADGQYVYLYDVENRLVEMRAQTNSVCTALSYAGQIKAKLRYDPLGRLYETTNYVDGVSEGAKRFMHDGDALIAVLDTSGTTIERHVHGPMEGVDDPLISYNGTGKGYPDARFLQSDARGSIVYSSDRFNTSQVINTYDEYGQPGTSNEGRFQYTGQVWLPELGMYYYKARIYSPALGRFMQTDPIGYEDNVNLYGYVGNDPINGTDFTGLEEDEPGFLQGLIEGVGQVLYDTFIANDGGPTPSGLGILFGAEPGTEVGGPATTDAQAAGRTTGQIATGVAAVAAGARGNGARAAASSTVAPKKAANITTEVRTRGTAGADGATSQMKVERMDGQTISTTHTVTDRGGNVIHQHQDHIGKAGSVRRFSDQTTGTRTVGDPPIVDRDPTFRRGSN